MRTTRKVLLALVLTLCVAAVLAVAAFAAMPTGQTKEEATDWEQNYADVASGDGWILLTTSDAIDPLCRVQPGEEAPVLVKTPGGKVYYNKTLKKVVIIASGTLAGDHGDGSSVSSSSFTKSIPVAYFIEDMWAVIEQHFASNDVAWTKRIGGTGYPTTIGGTETTGATWTWVYVIKSDYELMKVEFDRINADTTLTDDQKKIEKVKVAVNYAPRYQNKNVSEEGAMWTLGYLFKLMSADQTNYPFETLEFRVAKKGSLGLQNFSFITEHADSVKTIVLDSRIVMVSPQAEKDGSRGVFRNLAKLVSLGHVVYEDYSGEYKTDVAGATFVEGKVNVSGFTALGTAGHYGIFRDSPSITDVIWYTSFKYGSTEMAGKIDIRAFTNCTGLKTVTLTAPLTEIASNAFYKCTSLETINLRGGIADGATIATDAFASTTQNINVNVYSEADEAKAKEIFADFANITVENKSATVAAITADGFSIRIDDSSAFYKGPALRAEFTLLKENVDKAKAEEGYDLDDYGVVIFSEKTFKTLYNESVEAIMAAVLAEERPDKIIRRSAFNGPYVKRNENGDKTFAAAITGIDETNFDSAVYTYAYAKWTDGTNVKYTYTTYTSSRTHKTAHSLYDATVFAFSTGVVNSQNFKMTATGDEEKAVELWDILEKGAFTITKDDITAPNENLQIKYDLDNDTFTYLNEPLRAWKFNKYDSWSPYNPSWDAYGNYVEEKSTTNVLWSILRDGNDLIVAYRRDPDAEANATAFIPTILEGKLASAPYCSEYFDGIELVWEGGKQVPKERFIDTAGGNGIVKGSYVYTPIVSESVEERITTLVVDYGITNFKYRALGNSKTPSLTKIIYPENVSASSGLLAGNSYIESFIYAPVGIHQLPTETWAEGFGPVADLSGLKSFSFASAFDGCYKIQNLLLPQMTKSSTDIQTTFNGMRALKRAWTFGSPVPNEGTLDFSKTRITTICKRSFADFQMSKTMDLTLIMPETFTGIAAYSLKLSENEACSEVFGKDLAYTIDLGENVAALTSSTKGLLLFYERMLEANNDLDNNGTLGNKANYKGTGDVVYLVYELTDAQADNMNKIEITCKVNGVKQTLSLADWRTYCIDNDLYETTLAE